MANQSQILSAFLDSYNKASSKNKTRTFFATVRDVTKIGWFSEKGIREKFNSMSSEKFVKIHFTNPDSPDNLLSYVNYKVAEKLIAALGVQVQPNLSLDDSEEETPSEPVEKKTESKQEKQETITDAEVVEETKEEKTKDKKAKELPPPPVEKKETIIKPQEMMSHVKQEKVNAEFNLQIPLNGLVEHVVDTKLQEMDILKNAQNYIKEEAKKLQPNYIKIGERKEVKIEGLIHHRLKDAIKLCIRERQLFIAGPAGTGKTQLAHDVAKALDLPFGFISCTAGMSEAHLTGRMIFNGDYITSSFVECYEGGGIFLFDEVDAADANTMLVINSALANGRMSIPNRRDSNNAQRHPDFICICAANTWGYGSNEYVGRNMLDAAFLDRFFGAKMEVDYDRNLEAKIAGEHTKLLQAIWKVRENVQDQKIRKVISTRAVVSGVKALMDGETIKSYLDIGTTGWSREEKAKALTNVEF